MYSKHWACRLTDSSSPAAEDREMSTMSVLARRLGATGGVGNLILARPKALNALTLDMCRDVNRALSGWLADASLRCILLEGEGGRAFCAGGDVKTVALEGGEFVPGKPGTLRADFFREVAAVALRSGVSQLVLILDSFSLALAPPRNTFTITHLADWCKKILPSLKFLCGMAL
jgi:hypothetical protein